MCYTKKTETVKGLETCEPLPINSKFKFGELYYTVTKHYPHELKAISKYEDPEHIWEHFWDYNGEEPKGDFLIPETIVYEDVFYSVTAIESNTFYYCQELRSINIPTTIRVIGEGVFYSCAKLEAINVDSKNEYYTSVDGVLYDKELSKLIQYPIGSKQNSLNIPNTVKFIEEDAFMKAQNLVSVTLSDILISIGNNAFMDCHNLAEIKIPHSVSSIGWQAFRACTSLTNIELPNSLTAISSWTFYGCSALTEVKLPNSLVSIGRNAFCFCERLKSIDIPKTLTSIDDSAFCHCDSLTSIELPKSITSTREIFHGMEDALPSSVEIIEPISKGTKLYYKVISHSPCEIALVSQNESENFVDFFCRNEEGQAKEDLFIPETIEHNNQSYTITAIEDNTFRDWQHLRSIHIPKTITHIDDYVLDVFADCTALEAINVDTENKTYSSSLGVLYSKDKSKLIRYPIAKKTSHFDVPDTVSSIESYAFKDCLNLSSIVIPNSVSSIDDSVFVSCLALTSVVLPETLTYIGADAFNHCESLMSIDIPSSVTDIERFPFWGCKSLKSINVAPQNKHYTSVNGVLYTKDLTRLIKYPIASKAKAFNIPNGVTSIEECAFRECENLTEIRLPSTVCSIGNFAFEDCLNLLSIKIEVRDLARLNCSKFIFSDMWGNMTLNENCVLYIPKGMREEYQNTEPWCMFKYIREIGSDDLPF